MHVLYSKVGEARSLAKLFGSARRGDFIKIDPDRTIPDFNEGETTPSPRGIIGYTEDTGMRSVYLNGNPIASIYAAQYLPFGNERLVFRQGNQFYSLKNGKRQEIYTYKGNIREALPLLGGKLAIFDSDFETITVLTRKILRVSATVYKQPYTDVPDCYSLSSGAVITCDDGTFYRNGKKLVTCPEWKDPEQGKKTFSWYEYKNTVAISNGERVFTPNNEILHEGSSDTIYSCMGNIVVRVTVTVEPVKISRFSINGVVLHEEVPHERIYPHWWGPIMRYRGQLAMLVVK